MSGVSVATCVRLTESGKMWRCEVQKFPFSDDQLLLALGNWATLINIEDLALFLLLGAKLKVQAEGKFEG